MPRVLVRKSPAAFKTLPLYVVVLGRMDLCIHVSNRLAVYVADNQLFGDQLTLVLDFDGDIDIDTIKAGGLAVIDHGIELGNILQTFPYGFEEESQ